MKGRIQGISTTVLHVCRSRIWASVAIHSVALYLIWQCVKCQSSKSPQFKPWPDFKANVVHQSSPGQQHPESLARRVMKGSERSKLIAGAEHPKIIPWVVVKTCISDVTFCSQIILHCPTCSHPRTPKGEQASTGRDEYLLHGIGYLKCSSLFRAIHAALQLFPEKRYKTHRAHSIPEDKKAHGKHSQRGAGVLGSSSTHSSTILGDSKLFILQISFHLSMEFIPTCQEFFIN